MTTPIFERDGDRVVPTALARGPWDPGHCHGGAPAALLASLVDALPAPSVMQGVRLTYDLLRPVPLAPLRVQSRIARDGKRVQIAEAWLVDDGGTELMRCRALRLRIGDVPLPAPQATSPDPAIPDATTPDPATPDAPMPDLAARGAAPPAAAPEDLPRLEARPGWDAEGFWEAVDVRMVAGMLGEPGPGTAWFRVVAPLLDGLTLTPLGRVAAAADFGNGISSPLPMGPYLFVNPDLSVHLDRLPAGDWVAMESASSARSTGNGLTTSTLFDRDGRIGLAAQSLYVDAVR